MKTKKIISISAMVICTLAGRQVQANSESYANNNLTVVSTVTLETSGTYAGDYFYQYAVDGGTPNSDAFTVNGAELTTSPETFAPVDVTGVTGENAPTSSPINWNTGAVNDAHIDWSAASDTSIVGVTFSFYSPYAPIEGSAYAQDNSQYGPVEAYVPGPSSVPDGGMTSILLGGSFLVIGAVRRKLGRG